MAVVDVTVRMPLQVHGVAGQSANLIEWQDSSGTLIAASTGSGVVATGINTALPAAVPPTWSVTGTIGRPPPKPEWIYTIDGAR